MTVTLITSGTYSVDPSLTMEREGLKLTAYLCPAGKLTIGYGHTGDDVFAGMCITPDKADFLLTRDLMASANTVARLVKVDLNDRQFSALVDFVFNLGGGALAASTLLEKLNDSDYRGAADQFLLWDKAHVDGQLVVVSGLTIRRQREREEFLS